MLRITIKRDKKGQFYSTYKAKNGRKRVHSESYTRKENCDNSIKEMILDIKNDDYVILDLTTSTNGKK